MFNNRFNSSKNDPLVEAVKAARADGDARRLAESMANDLFGVFSRKAVVREYLSDYDYALEEAYKCVKEEDKMADKDYDRDGKIETSKKEVWGSRLRAAKASGKYKGPVDEKKMWEGSGVSGEDPGMEVARKAGATQQSQTPSSTPKRTDNAAGSTISNARAATGMNEAKIKVKGNDPLEARAEYAKKGGTGQVYKKTHPKDKVGMSQADAYAIRGTGPKRGSHLPEEALDELSRTTLKSYVKKANRQANDLERKVNTRKDKPGEEDKMYRRIDGVNLAHDKMKVRVAATNEEALDEISKELAGRYIKKADYKRSDSSFQSGKIYGKELATKRRTKQDVEDARKHNRDAYKREKGINTAVNKLTGKAKVAANEEVMKESIVAKLFAKHMREDSSFKSAQVIEANAFDLGKTVPDASMKIRGGAYPSIAARIKGMATAAKGIAGSAVRGLAKGLGNPVSAGVMAAMEPTPANSGENEFARQAKYGAKPTPASGRTGAGMNKAMNRVSSSVTSKPAAAPASAPAPKPAAAPASAPAKSSFYKGGSQGDYTIKRGDTLSGIAKRTGQSVSDLASMNKISDVNKISSGAKLMTKVPTPPARPADISKPTEPAASKPYKPVSPDTDIDRKISSAGVTIGTVKTPTAADDPDATGYTSREYGSKVSRDFNDVRPQSSPQSSSPAPEPAKPAAPAPEPKKKEAGAAPAAPMAESVVTVGANKYRIV